MTAAVRIERLSGSSAGCELAHRPIAAHLAGHVQSWVGYEERCDGPSRRRELPTPRTVVIVEFEPTLEVFEGGGLLRSRRYPGGFVAGLDERPSFTEHPGYQAGIQINLTPLGTRALFQRPLHELAGEIVPLAELIPRDERFLAEQLAATRSWERRFDLVQGLIERRIRSAPGPHAAVQWALQQIATTRGTLDVGRLAQELGVSRKHLVTLFRAHVGVPPKLYARLTRFDRVMQRIKGPAAVRWAELAFEFGYADQAHLARDIRRFSGITPTQARQLVDSSPNDYAFDPAR